MTELLVPTRTESASPRASLAIRARGLVKTYGHGDAAVRALDHADLDVAPGTFTAIMGPSGSGKSTLMHLLAGLDKPTEGSVTIDGVELNTLDDAGLTKLRRDKIGFVFQAFNLVPVLTAEENVALPLTLAGLEPGDRVTKVLEAVRQMRGEAHPAVQVPNCDLALAHGTGGSLSLRMMSSTLILGVADA